MRFYFYILLSLFILSCENTAQENTVNFVPKTEVNTTGNYKLSPPVIPSAISFCGEEVPILRKDVYESLDREFLINMYWQSQTFLFLKRAHKWFPIIEPILKENGVPDDFKYLAVIESGLMNVVSPSGARGFWQFMPKTAKDHGLEVNGFVDERYHVEKATQAACVYLKEAYNKFGDWTLAAASYNMGKAGLEKRLQQQKVSSYYDLLLNMETARYVYRMIAVKTIIANPSKYGFYLEKEDYYEFPAYTEIKVDSSISNLVDFAQQHDLTYKEFKWLNPWLRDRELPNPSGKEYVFKILKQ